MRGRIGHKVLMAGLGLGAVLGFASGIASIGHHHHHRRARFEQHVAGICAQAALDAQRQGTAPAAAPAAGPFSHHSHRSCD